MIAVPGPLSPADTLDYCVGLGTVGDLSTGQRPERCEPIFLQ